jgi:uncharacterized membrane protein YfcA
VSVLALLLVSAIGLLIGLIGLGGFLLVPVLVLLQGTSTREAVVVAAVAFLAGGVLSLAAWTRRAPGEVAAHGPYLLATAPGAVVGAFVVGAVMDRALGLLIAAAFATAAIAEWFGLPRGGRVRPLAGVRAVGAGVATGFGSAVTGTSGPMVAMPLLAWAGLSLRDRIAIGQVAQVPIALGATIMFAGLGAIPWTLAGLCSAALCAGILASRLLAHRVPAAALRRMSALLMLAAAAALLVRHA